ncbi:MAG: HEPN domain-containing protein [Paludibacteraceae bacterium]|nr:HEPN domain-containing protein [Paludibacteraceae bacterium]
MTLSDEERKQLVQHHLTKAEQMLIQAEEMYSLSHYDMAVNRYYYACFHAVHALLVANGLSAKTHEGLLAVFGKEFVLTGKTDRKYSSFLARMEQLRKKADYNCVYDVSASDVSDKQIPAHELLNEIKRLINI